MVYFASEIISWIAYTIYIPASISEFVRWRLRRSLANGQQLEWPKAKTLLSLSSCSKHYIIYSKMEIVNQYSHLTELRGTGFAYNDYISWKKSVQLFYFKVCHGKCIGKIVYHILYKFYMKSDLFGLLLTNISCLTIPAKWHGIYKCKPLWLLSIIRYKWDSFAMPSRVIYSHIALFLEASPLYCQDCQNWGKEH